MKKNLSQKMLVSILVLLVILFGVNIFFMFRLNSQSSNNEIQKLNNIIKNGNLQPLINKLDKLDGLLNNTELLNNLLQNQEDIQKNLNSINSHWNNLQEIPYKTYSPSLDGKSQKINYNKTTMKNAATIVIEKLIESGDIVLQNNNIASNNSSVIKGIDKTTKAHYNSWLGAR